MTKSRYQSDKCLEDFATRITGRSAAICQGQLQLDMIISNL